MSVVLHDDLPIYEVPRIKTRILVSGAQQTAVWEQWIEKDGFIPLHYHEVEEVLVLLEGEVKLTHNDVSSQVQAPATITIPAREVHGLHPIGNSVVHLLAFFPTASPIIFAPDGTERPLPWQDNT